MHDRIRQMRPATYYGSRVDAYRAAGFHLVESVYESREELPAHAHTNAHFCLVLSGAYTEDLEGGAEGRRPADLIYYPAAVDHAEYHETPGRHFLIEIEPALGSLLPRPRRAAPRVSIHGGGRTLASRLYSEFRRGGEASRATIEQLVRCLVAHAEQAAGRASVGASDWVVAVAARLRGSSERPPALDELAAAAGVHPVHLGRTFRRVYGCTPGQYLRRIRVEFAQRAIGDGVEDLAGVAHAAGFCDQSHLNRVFKRHVGVSPGRYRRLVRAGD